MNTMKKIEKLIGNSLQVYGIIFIISVGLSFFIPVFQYLEKSKGFLLCYFVAITLGNIWRNNLKTNCDEDTKG